MINCFRDGHRDDTSVFRMSPSMVIGLAEVKVCPVDAHLFRATEQTVSHAVSVDYINRAILRI